MFGKLIFGTVINVIRSGVLTKGAWKAHAGGVAGAVITAATTGLGPVIQACTGAAGAGFEDIGSELGKMAAAYLFGFLVTWLAPKNKPAQ